MKDHGAFRPFVQFQRIRLHSSAFNLLRHQRGERICQELDNFLTAVKFEYPYGVRQSTLLEAIQSNKRIKFSKVNFTILKSCFTLSDLSKLPGTSTEYETGGMWVDGDIHPYDEKKYKGLKPLRDWEKDQWMVPRCKEFSTDDGLKYHIEEVFRKSNFDQELTEANHQDQLDFCIEFYYHQIVAELEHLHEVYHSNHNPLPPYSLRQVFELMISGQLLIGQNCYLHIINLKTLFRRRAEENVYSLSETMTENVDSCAALSHMEAISDSIGNHEQFNKVFVFYNINYDDIQRRDHYQICKKIINHEMFRFKFSVQEYRSNFNATTDDFVQLKKPQRQFGTFILLGKVDYFFNPNSLRVNFTDDKTSRNMTVALEFENELFGLLTTDPIQVPREFIATCKEVSLLKSNLTGSLRRDTKGKKWYASIPRLR